MGNGGIDILRHMRALRAHGTERIRTLYYIAVAVLAALVPLILFAGLWVRTAVDQSEHDLRNFLISRAHTLSARLNAEIEQQWSIMQAITSVQSLDEPNLSAFQLTASRIVAASPQWASIALIDPETGRHLVDTRRTAVEEVQTLIPSEVLAQVIESRSPVAIPRYPGEGGGQGAIFLYMPAIREGQVRTVLVVELKAEVVQQILSQVEGDDLLMAIIDDDGRILARSHRNGRFFGAQASDDLQRSIAGREEGLFAARTLDNREVVTAFRRSALTGWRAIAAMERGRFDALGDRSTWALIGTGAFSLTLAGILAIFLFHSVIERRVADERLAASRALNALDARLLATTQEALIEQRKSASEREILLREIYHRVKNNLQIVQSLLRLGSRDLQPDQREPFEGAIRRIGAMARVHSLLYKSPDLSSINFKDYLQDLAKEIGEGFGADMQGIVIAFDVEPMRVPLDTAVPLAFVAVEILTNAFKHAFPDGRQGRITITAHEDGERGVLTITDNGIGLPGQPRGRRQLGLHLVNKLVEQIDGTIEAPPPGGSTYRVTFPLNSPEAAPLPQKIPG